MSTTNKDLERAMSLPTELTVDYNNLQGIIVETPRADTRRLRTRFSFAFFREGSDVPGYTLLPPGETDLTIEDGCALLTKGSLRGSGTYDRSFPEYTNVEDLLRSLSC